MAGRRRRADALSEQESAERSCHWPAEAERAWRWLHWRFGEGWAMATRSDGATTVASGTAEGFDLCAGDRIVIKTPEGAQGGDFSFHRLRPGDDP